MYCVVHNLMTEDFSSKFAYQEGKTDCRFCELALIAVGWCRRGQLVNNEVNNAIVFINNIILFDMFWTGQMYNFTRDVVIFCNNGTLLLIYSFKSLNIVVH